MTNKTDSDFHTTELQFRITEQHIQNWQPTGDGIYKEIQLFLYLKVFRPSQERCFSTQASFPQYWVWWCQNLNSFCAQTTVPYFSIILACHRYYSTAVFNMGPPDLHIWLEIFNSFTQAPHQTLAGIIRQPNALPLLQFTGWHIRKKRQQLLQLRPEVTGSGEHTFLPPTPSQTEGRWRHKARCGN